MPSNATRRRVDWCPGDAAFEALEIGEQLFANLPRQEVIDRLVITGLCALKHPPWAPPPLFGRERDRWKLPSTARFDQMIPGIPSTQTAERPANSRGMPQAWMPPGNLLGKEPQ